MDAADPRLGPIDAAALAVVISRTLRLRQVPERTATLAADAAVDVFNVAYADWIAGPDDALDALMPISLTDLRRAVGLG